MKTNLNETKKAVETVLRDYFTELQVGMISARIMSRIDIDDKDPVTRARLVVQGMIPLSK